MRKNSKYCKGAFAVLLLACATTAFAGKVDAIFTHAGLAIRGYDPVTYHLQAQPAKGTPQFSCQWRGATWLFATAENRDSFQAEPERYAPQYGGYCAYAVSKGRTASIDPEAWRVVDGKLYLNYSRGVQKKWETDVLGNIIKADKNWPDLHK
jgi:YHS domain-containing protein